MTNTDARTQGLALLEEEATPRVAELARQAEEAGALWVYDPQVASVIGLVDPRTERALLVCYVTTRDFELSSELEELSR